MKNSNFIKNSIIALLPISLGLGVLFGISNNKAEGVEAYSGASLPTTIYLNDSSDSQIRNYYSGLNSLSSTERKGENLLKNLKTILSNGQKYYNYDTGDIVWKMYEITDRDWEKSPASSTVYGTYNKSENKISNYVYGSNKDGKNNPYLRAYYMDRSQENVVKAWGNHNQDATGINREHLWAKAEGFDGEGGAAAGARGDPMHLVAANGYANKVHSNNYYGYVDKSKSYDDVKDVYNTLGHSLSGKSKTFPESSRTVFEPQDCDKGDIARAIFYMAARYNNIAGKTASQETFDADNPNLLVTDDLNTWKSSGYTSSATTPGYYGLVTDLLEWNKIDPPDEYEIHRNNLLYTNFTNNRNPFIDFPQWADICFGKSTSSADPVSDPINGQGIAKTLTSISVTTQPNKTTYIEDEKFSVDGMVVTAKYSDNSTKVITDYTYSPNGALALGTEKITISYEGKTTEVAITVTSKGSEKIKYFEKVESNLKSGKYLIVSDTEGVAWKDGQSGSAHAMAITHDENNHISYTSDLFNAQFTLNIADGSILAPNGKYIYQDENVTGVKASDTAMPNVLSLTNGELTIQGTGGRVVKCNNNSDKPTFNFYSSTSKYSSINIYKYVETSEIVHPTSVTVSPKTATIEIGTAKKLAATVLPIDAAIKSVTWVSLNEDVASVDQTGRVVARSVGTAEIQAISNDGEVSLSDSCFITVPQPVVLDSLEISGTFKTDYYVGDSFNKNGLIVNAVYKQGSTVVEKVDVTDEAEFNGFDSSTIGTKTIIVSYNDCETTFDIKVTEVPVEENTIKIVSSTLGYENGVAVSEIKQDNFEITLSKGTNANNAPKYYTFGSAIRFYSGNTFTIKGAYKIVSVKLVFASDDKNSITCDKGSFNEATGLWSNASSVDNLTFTIGGSSGHRKIAEIHIKYDPTTPTAKELLNITLEGDYPKVFDVGDDFKYDGLIVKAHYNDGSDSTVTPDSVTGANMNVDGEQEITVSYTENAVTKTATYTIKVNKVILLDYIELSGKYTTEYFVGESFSRDGLIVTAYYTDNSHKVVNPSSISGYDMNTPSDSQEITVTYVEDDIEESAYYNIKVKDILPEKLVVSNIEKTNYVVGDEFNKNLTATVTYNNGASKNVIPTEFKGTDLSSSGSKTITVIYSEKGIEVSDQYTITIDKIMPESIVISGDFKRNFYVGDEFEYTGLKATITFNNGSVEMVTPEVSAPDMTTSGQKDVTVSYSLNGKSVSDKYTITVEELKPTKITLGGTYQKQFFKGDKFDSTGLVVKATYNNGETVEVKDYTISKPNMDVVSNSVPVTVSYTKGGVTQTATYNISIIAKLTSLTVDQKCKNEYFVGDKFDSTGLVVSAHYNDNTSKIIDPIFEEPSLEESGTKEVELTYEENGISMSTSFDVIVKDIVLESIKLSGTKKTEFEYDEEFSYEGLIVTAVYNNGTSKKVNPTSVTGYNGKQPGQQTITVTYEEDGVSARETYQILVKEQEKVVVLESITLSGDYKTNYFIGEEFDSSNLVVTAHYSDGSSKAVIPSNIKGFNKDTSGEQNILVSYIEGGLNASASYKVNVELIKLTSISLSGSYQKVFTYGSPFNSDGLIVTAHYNNGTEKVVTPKSITGYDSSKVGQSTITVTYDEDEISVNTTYVVTVNPNVDPTPDPTPQNDDNTVVVIAAASGSVVAVGGAITGISIGVHRKHKCRGK